MKHKWINIFGNGKSFSIVSGQVTRENRAYSGSMVVLLLLYTITTTSLLRLAC